MAVNRVLLEKGLASGPKYATPDQLDEVWAAAGAYLALLDKAGTEQAPKKDNEKLPTPAPVSGYRFGKASLDRLDRVHPDLQKVMKRALDLSPIDFSISQGLRTLEQQHALYAQGRTKAELEQAGLHGLQPIAGSIVTWSLKSKHLTGKAVDVAAMPHGVLSWNEVFYNKIAEAVKSAATELHISVVWGGDWKTTKDRPHFELDSKVYPDA